MTAKEKEMFSKEHINLDQMVLVNTFTHKNFAVWRSQIIKCIAFWILLLNVINLDKSLFFGLTQAVSRGLFGHYHHCPVVRDVCLGGCAQRSLPSSLILKRYLSLEVVSSFRVCFGMALMAKKVPEDAIYQRFTLK